MKRTVLAVLLSSVAASSFAAVDARYNVNAGESDAAAVVRQQLGDAREVYKPEESTLQLGDAREVYKPEESTLQLGDARDVYKPEESTLQLGDARDVYKPEESTLQLG